MADSMERVNQKNYSKMLEKLEQKLHKNKLDNIQEEQKAEYDAKKALWDLEESNLDRIQKRKEENIKKLTELGLVATKKEFDDRLSKINDEIAKAEAAEASGTGKKSDTKKLKAKKKQLEKENEIREKLEKATRIKDNKAKIEDIKKQAKEAGLAGKAYADAVASGIEAAGISADDLKEVKKASAKEKAIETATKARDAIYDFAAKLDSQIDNIAANQGEIDTRLQGSKANTKSGSYWKQISSDIKSVAAVSPFVKQEAIVEKVKSMVSQGISYNVEQRAFLATISDKIANTFNAADGTLLRLVRLQQQDSTAARLGMESAMTSFLNNMYETTEYMGAIADGVRKNIEEATALMSAEESIGFEYQVQKWLGSMYSVGMSDSATSAIAGALGKLGAGDISGLNGDGMGNLMIMAANNAGLNISELLADGLDESSTNRLMKAMVEYLSGIYDSSKDSKVLQQQFANVYGLTASDLKAIANLKTDTSIIAADGLNYNSALGQLNAMAASIAERTSMGEMLGNMWSNFQYTMAEGIGSNMVTYGLYKAGNLMDSLNLGKTQIYGTMVDIPGLMKTGAMLGGIMAGIPQIAAGIGNSFSGTSMLSQLGIGSGITSVARGNGQGLTTTGGSTVSVSGGVTGSGQDIVDTETQGVENQAAAVNENDTETNLDDVNTTLISIQNVMAEFKDAFELLSSGGSIKVSSESGSSSWSKEIVTAL